MGAGSLGDHPLSDVLIHGRPTYSPEIDRLIQRIDVLDGWGSELKAGFMWMEFDRLEDCRKRGDDEGARILLNNLGFVLRSEIELLGGDET